MTFTAQQKMNAVNREVKQRIRVYARLVEQGKMSVEKASFETDIMREIASDYHVIVVKERLI